jgi:hypothetical protein
MRRAIWIVLLIAYAGGIAFVSHQPIGQGVAAFPYADKLFHAGEFGVLLFLAWQATGHRLLLSLILTAAFAASDEVHQAFVPTRDASVWDGLADLVGGLLMALLIHSRTPLWRLFRKRILGRTSQEGG